MSSVGVVVPSVVTAGPSVVTLGQSVGLSVLVVGQSVGNSGVHGLTVVSIVVVGPRVVGTSLQPQSPLSPFSPFSPFIH